jgi:hypothetical protein
MTLQNCVPAKKLGSGSLLGLACVLFLLAGVCRAGAWQMLQAPLMTQWASQIDTNNPLPEYPRPQLVRTDWTNLNGIWQFQPGATNDAVPTGQTLSSQILVPYPMESAISGVMQYHEFSWYRRTFTVPPAWSSRHIILHLDAVEWQATVYVNGQKLGVHKGGYDPFSYDITSYLNGGTNELILQVYSPEDNGGQPRGKQTLYPGGIMYTSASGIWQPVWLEPVDASGVNNLQIVPDVDHSRLQLTVNTYVTGGISVVATVSSNGVVVSTTTGNPQTVLNLPVPSANLWSPENPFLYDLQVAVTYHGVTNDTVTSYFGMRKISISVVGGVPQIYLNNQPYFAMGPLDQGFWPDGIYTAPTDAALKYDLQEEKAFGFNAVRKHIKVERQRWYYWADKLGLIVWQDMPSCNSYTGNPNPPMVDPLDYIAELTAMVTNHWDSPCIIMWDVFNEGQGEAGSGDGVGQTNTAYLVSLVKTIDPSRLVNQASGGNYFGVGDVLDSHSYPDPGDPMSTTQAPVDGEFGGIAWHVNGHLWNPAEAGSGYLLASSVNNIADLYDQYITEAVNFKSIPNGGLNAAIYTQITDVENECNGLMTYDRIPKPDPFRIMISNQKAISGQLSVTTVVPTSQVVPQSWQYTTNTPATNWYAANFNASSWNTGYAGFGTADPGVTPNTSWTTTGYIYLRRTFNPGPLTPLQISNLTFTVYHDEDVAIYINGVFAGSASGYSTSYVPVAMTAQAKAAIIPNGQNVLAVSCYQTTGGQFIDVGIADETLVANTLTVPTDYAGYWPLDATSGTVAADLSGNNNNGSVVGATWNASGQINGCLAFNGVNNYVQIANGVSNDFSIAFWVKTTQTGGTGNWYQGTGLIDGDVAAGVNDFGTSLLGSHFAFGTGKPDTTIVSAASINDGQWHQCVATRQQATGTLKIYVDGVLQATGVGGTNSLLAASYLRFGSLQTGTGFFNGSLDEIKIYSRALGNNEVTALYDSSGLPPAPPANLTAAAGNDQVNLNWLESVWATSYTVSRSVISGGPYTVIGTTTGTTFTDTNVADGTTYYYVVTAVNPAGPGTNSNEIGARPFNVAVWYRADAITGLASGSSVATWPDLSGNTNNATQSAAAQQPVYVTGAMHGNPVVRFNSTNSTYLAFNRTVQDDFTMMIAYQSRQANQGTGTSFYQGAGLVNGDQPFTQNDFGTALNANGLVLAGTGNPDVSITSGGGYNDGKPHIVTFERIESSRTLLLYVDSVLVASGIGGTNPLTAPSILEIGAVPSGGGFLSGDIGDVKIFTSALDDSDRIAEEASLECKYGLGGGSAPAIPTGFAGTAASGQVVLGWGLVAGAESYDVYRSTDGITYSLLTNTITAGFTDASAVNGKTNYYQVAAADACGTSATTAPVAIVLSQPTLSAAGVGLAAGGRTLTLQWPGWAANWQLYAATNLLSPIVWLPVTNAVGSSNGLFNVSVPVGLVNQYFRLSAP